MKALKILKNGVKLMNEELERNPATKDYIDNEIKIYNEAIVELEALQNRSCESCKYSKVDDFDNIYCDMFQCYQQKALKYCGNWGQNNE